MKKGEGFKIRKRGRVQSSPPAGMDQEWTEYQVVSGRGKITARYGTLGEAQREFPGAELDSTVTHADGEFTAVPKEPSNG
jgi:hypothetical protein